MLIGLVVQAHNHHGTITTRGVLNLTLTLFLFLGTALLLALSFLLQTLCLTVLTPAALTTFLPAAATTVVTTLSVTVAVVAPLFTVPTTLTITTSPSVSLSLTISSSSLLSAIQKLLNCVKIEVVSHLRLNKANPTDTRARLSRLRTPIGDSKSQMAGG